MKWSCARPSRDVASLPVELIAWWASARRPLPIQTSSSGETGAVTMLAAGMRVTARARARSAVHSSPNLSKVRGTCEYIPAWGLC